MIPQGPRWVSTKEHGLLVGVGGWNLGDSSEGVGETIGRLTCLGGGAQSPQKGSEDWGPKNCRRVHWKPCGCAPDGTSHPSLNTQYFLRSSPRTMNSRHSLPLCPTIGMCTTQSAPPGAPKSCQKDHHDTVAIGIQCCRQMCPVKNPTKNYWGRGATWRHLYQKPRQPLGAAWDSLLPKKNDTYN